MITVTDVATGKPITLQSPERTEKVLTNIRGNALGQKTQFISKEEEKKEYYTSLARDARGH